MATTFTLIYFRHMVEYRQEFEKLNDAIRFAAVQEDLGNISARGIVGYYSGEVVMNHSAMHWAMQQVWRQEDDD